MADFLSRGKYLTLKRSIFLRICHLFPPPEIDLFASVLTFQLPKYCSRVPQVWAYRRDVVPVVRAPFIRVSSFQSAPQSPSESGSRWSRPPSDSPPPPLASETLVSSPLVSSSGTFREDFRLFRTLFIRQSPSFLTLIWIISILHSGCFQETQPGGRPFSKGYRFSTHYSGLQPDVLILTMLEWQASNGVPSHCLIHLQPL